MRQQTAVLRAYTAARRLGEPILVRTNADGSWWWFERLSWYHEAQNIRLVPKYFRFIIHPDGRKESINASIST